MRTFLTILLNPPLGQLGNAPGLIQSVGLGATYTFTPSLLFDWNFGYTRQRLGAQFDLGSPKGLDLLKSTARAALTSLVASATVEQRGEQYVVVDPLFAEWIANLRETGEEAFGAEAG